MWLKDSLPHKLHWKRSRSIRLLVTLMTPLSSCLSRPRRASSAESRYTATKYCCSQTTTVMWRNSSGQTKTTTRLRPKTTKKKIKLFSPTNRILTTTIQVGLPRVAVKAIANAVDANRKDKARAIRATTPTKYQLITPANTTKAIRVSETKNASHSPQTTTPTTSSLNEYE